MSMGTLFSYELKKLLSRKLVWPLLAACVAMQVWVFWPYVSFRQSGAIDGMRAAYRAYEGRTVNDSLVKKVKADLNEYIAAHPGDFVTSSSGLDEDIPYYPSELGFTYGYWNACSDIIHQQTEEARWKLHDQIQRILTTGQDDDGNALTQRARYFYEHALSVYREPTVVHYAEGWRQLPMQVQWQGLYVLILFIPALRPLFTGESTAKTDGILLCAARRRQAAAAKLLAACLYATVMTLVVYGLPLLFTGLTYGLDGASQPASALNGFLPHRPGETVGFVYLKAGIVSLLAAVACALVVALGSALFRRPRLPCWDARRCCWRCLCRMCSATPVRRSFSSGRRMHSPRAPPRCCRRFPSRSQPR